MKRTFYRHKLENLVSFARVVTAHILHYGKDFAFAGERHDFWEMVYVEENDVLCGTEAGGEFPLRAGELLFHCPNEFHTIRANGRTGAKVYVVSFECRSEAMQFFREKKVRLPDAGAPLLQGIFREARSTFALPDFDPGLTKLELRPDAILGGKQMLRTYLEQLLIVLMRSETESGRSEAAFVKKEEAAHLAQAVTDYLKANLYATVTLEQLCREFHYSRTYLCGKFREATRSTIFYEYARLKAEEAKKLLARPNLTVSEVSALLCFDTPAYFATTFKKFTGITPREYRKRGAPTLPDSQGGL